jgi:hypothetical protein
MSGFGKTLECLVLADSVEKLDFEVAFQKFRALEALLFSGDGGPYAAHSNAATISVDALMNAPHLALPVATTNTAIFLVPEIGVFNRICPLRSSTASSQVTALQGGFNRSMQHTNHRLSGRSVADETATKDLLLG